MGDYWDTEIITPLRGLVVSKGLLGEILTRLRMSKRHFPNKVTEKSIPGIGSQNLVIMSRTFCGILPGMGYWIGM